MIFHYAGKFDGQEEHLPQREQRPGDHRFREPEDMKKLSQTATAGCVITIAVLAVPCVIRGLPYFADRLTELVIACFCTLLVLLPHELLHAVCFKKDVYMYQDLAQGMLFVTGTEDLSKARFIFMSLLPNLVFGLVPYIVFLVCPRLVGLGAFGLLCLGMGFGDYMNVYNAATQMPKHARAYLSGMHTYWHEA